MTPEEKREHDGLHWTFCYIDNCNTHVSDKMATGWFPRKPKRKPKRSASQRARDAEEKRREKEEEGNDKIGDSSLCTKEETAAANEKACREWIEGSGEWAKRPESMDEK